MLFEIAGNNNSFVAIFLKKSRGTNCILILDAFHAAILLHRILSSVCHFFCITTIIEIIGWQTIWVNQRWTMLGLNPWQHESQFTQNKIILKKQKANNSFMSISIRGSSSKELLRLYRRFNFQSISSWNTLYIFGRYNNIKNMYECQDSICNCTQTLLLIVSF